jgi:excisionase family DNA binding protein
MVLFGPRRGTGGEHRKRRPPKQAVAVTDEEPATAKFVAATGEFEDRRAEYALAREDRIPHLRFGRTLRFRAEAIDQWLQEQEQTNGNRRNQQ